MQESDRFTSLRDIISILFKYKNKMLLIILSSLLMAFVYITISDEIYEANVKILVKIGREKVTEVSAYSREATNFLFQERMQNINNEIEILKSDYLIRRTALQLKEEMGKGIGTEKATWKTTLKKYIKGFIRFFKETTTNVLYNIGFMKKLSDDDVFLREVAESFHVENLEDTDVIQASFRWKNPEIASAALNIHISEYLSHHIEIHGIEKSKGFYNEQISVYEKKLKTIEDSLGRFVDGNRISNISLQKEVLVKDIAELEKKHLELVVKLEALLFKIGNIKEAYEKTRDWIETPTIGMEGSEITDLKKLDEAYFKLMGEKNRLLESYKPDSREVQIAENQIDKLRKQKYESLMNLLYVEKSVEESRRKNYERNMAAKNRELNNYNSNTLPLEQLQRSRDILQGEYLFYRKKADEFRVFNDLNKMKITSVKLIDRPLPPIAPKYPKKRLIFGLSGLLGIFFGLVWTLISEYFDHTFNSESDVKRILGLPLLLSIPEFGRKNRLSTIQGMK